MKHFCVIGDPVEHSLSPRLHRRMIELTGLDATYDLCPVRAQELERFVEQARGGAWDGFNVTMPHKEAVVPYLDGLSGTAARCRAVNTVCMTASCTPVPQTAGILTASRRNRLLSEFLQ